MVELHTPRLILTPYRDDEAEEVYAALMENADHLAPYIGLFAIRDRWEGDPQTMLDLLRGAHLDVNKTELAIRDRKTQGFLGGACIIRELPDGGPTSLGYWLLKDALGKGYATEALQELVRTVLSTEPKVRVDIETTNIPSLRVAERVGFRVARACAIPWPDGTMRPGIQLVQSAGRSKTASPKQSIFPILRVARPTDHLDAITTMYTDGLSFESVGRFEDHDGFDGAILSHPNAPYHLEFTSASGHVAGRSPSKDHLLVFYLPDASEWTQACEKMTAAGFTTVPSFNPYWDQHGRTFEDLEGYRVVLQNTPWDR